ncbi:MAG: septum formation initiator family protein [Dehalococcoidia bacterium]
MATAPTAEGASAPAELLHTPSLPLLLTIAALAIGLAALLPLIQSSSATSTNGNIRLLEQDLADWQARLREMELEVAGLSSLNRIEQEARTRLGMVQPEETTYITVPGPAPLTWQLPDRFLPETIEQPQPGASLWDKAFGWIPLP